MKKIIVIMFVLTLIPFITCGNALAYEGNTEDYIQIQKGWNWTIDDYGRYSYVRGTIKNISNKPIRYYEIAVRYYDKKDNMLDSAFTTGMILYPGDVKRFEIMRQFTHDMKTVDIRISKITFAN